MNVTVFGSSGFIGINVVKALAQAGYQVTASDVRPLPVCHNIHFVKADLRRYDQVEQAMHSADVVVHLAASPLNYSREDPVGNARVNIMGSLNIIDLARKYDVSKVIFSSASSIVGTVHSDFVDESQPCHPATPYGVAKHTVEQYLRVYHELYNTTYLTFRFFNIYGPWQYPSSGALIPIIWSRLKRGEPFTVYGTGSQIRDFVYVKDVAGIITDAVGNGVRNTVINLGTGKGTTIKELVDLSGEVLGVTPNINYQPERPGEIANFVADSHRLRRFFKNREMTELRTGLTKTFDWLSSSVKEVR